MATRQPGGVVEHCRGQITADAAQRGLARYYRIGPAGRPLDDPIYSEQQRAFDGIGLRPYAPAQLRLSGDGGAIDVGWIRRTRFEGDAWGETEVPLNEAVELYALRVVQNGAVLHSETVMMPTWRYTAAQQAADGATAPFAIEVAQVSDRFGPGLYRRAVWLG